MVDFDRTFIRENLLTAWVLFVLLRSSMKPMGWLRFLLQGCCRGIVSYALSHHKSSAELAVKIAYGAFRGAPTATLRDFILGRSPWSGGFALNLNLELLAVLQKLMETPQRATSSKPKIVITSQGSSEFAIKTFLTRLDVLAALSQAGIGIDLGDNRAIIANRAEVIDDCFTGRLVPPIITKYNRLQAFPAPSVFVGDGKDEWALRALGEASSTVRFINYRKLL